MGGATSKGKKRRKGKKSPTTSKVVVNKMLKEKSAATALGDATRDRAD
jgi:hypothetical protein